MPGIPADTEIIWGIKIEGVGKLTGGGDDEPFRYTAGVPSGYANSDGLYLPVLEGIPSYRLAADLLSGGLRGGGWTATLTDTDAVFDLLARYRPAAAGALTTTVSASATTLVTDITGADGTLGWIGLEAFRYGTEGTSGTYTGCLRGELGTLAVEHDVSNDASIFDVPVHLPGRRVTLFYIPGDASAITEEVDVQQFSLRNVQRKGTRWHLTLGSGLDLLRQATLLPHQWTAQVMTAREQMRRSPRGARLVSLRAVPRPGETSARFPENMTAWSNDPDDGDTALVEIDGSIFEITLLDASAGTPIYVFDPALPWQGQGKPLELDGFTDGARTGLAAREVFVSGYGALANKGSNAIDVARVLLTSTASGSNGAFDSGVEFGVELLESMIDGDGFEECQASEATGMETNRFWVGLGRSSEDDGKAALLRIESELLLPWGAFFSRSVRSGAEGALTIRRWGQGVDPSRSTVAFSDQDASMTTMANETAGYERLLNRLNFKFNADYDNSRLSLDVRNLTIQGRRRGGKTNLVIDASGTQGRSAAFNAAMAFVERFGVLPVAVSFMADLAFDAPPGEIATVTHTEITGVDASGDPVRGVTDSLLWITRQDLATPANAWVYEGLHIGLDFSRYAHISPAAKIIGVSLSDLDVEENHFVATNHPYYDKDSDGFDDGDACIIVDQYGSVKATGVTVDGTPTADVITCSGLGAYSYAAGDILIFADYDDQVASQKEEFASIADTNGELGAAGDDGYQYL
jgi:hypothetical protein